MVFGLLALDHRVVVPVNAKPLEAFEDVLGEFRLGSLLVGVFNAQQEATVLVSRKQPVENGRPRRADVEGSRRAGSQTNANHAKS